jgi:hypothetical protein
MAYRKANLVPGGITLDFPTRYLIEAQRLSASLEEAGIRILIMVDGDRRDAWGATLS